MPEVPARGGSTTNIFHHLKLHRLQSDEFVELHSAAEVSPPILAYFIGYFYFWFIFYVHLTELWHPFWYCFWYLFCLFVYILPINQVKSTIIYSFDFATVDWKSCFQNRFDFHWTFAHFAENKIWNGICRNPAKHGHFTYEGGNVSLLHICFYRLHIQILGRKHLLLSLLPPSAQPVSGGVLPEGSEEVPQQEDWLRGRHEDTLHQRSDETSQTWSCFIFQTTSFSLLLARFPVFASRVWTLLPSLCLPPQGCPSTRSTETSLCAPRICCPSPTWTQMPASPFRCPSKKTWTTCRSSHSRLLCFTHQAKVHRGRRPGVSSCPKLGLRAGLIACCSFFSRREEDPCSHPVSACGQLTVRRLRWSRRSGHDWTAGLHGYALLSLAQFHFLF